jgi:hypothetical protein
MRNLKELYTILLDRIEKGDYTNGICYYILNIWTIGSITKRERYSMFNHFLTKKPKNHFNKFYWSKHFTGGIYWWTKTPEGKEQRIKFIKHLISKL